MSKRTWLCLGLLAAAMTVGQEVVVERDFWSYDAAEFGDGRPDQMEAAAAIEKTGRPPTLCGWQDYVFSVPETGWYSLWYRKWGGLTHRLFIDGKEIYFGGITGWPGQPPPKEKDFIKGVNLPLTAGEHTLRFQRLGRVGFPGTFPTGWQLRTAAGPNDTVSARIDGFDVVRVGEAVKLAVTGGGAPMAASYEIICENLITGTEKVVAKIDFGAGGKIATPTIAIPATTEGAFRLKAAVDGELLAPCEFRAGDFAVVDITTTPPVGTDTRELIAEIDCVAQTLNGEPVDAARFVECNGATRVVESPLGAYRESNDGRGPEVVSVELSHEFPNQFSGFAYRLTVPSTETAYLLEVDYPDDTWRHITFPVADYVIPEDPEGKIQAYVPPGGGVMCGGVLPISNTMQTYRSVFWVNHPDVLLGVVSQRIGFRAGAARIRVYQFPTGLPPALETPADGRVYMSWHEKADDWDMTTNIDPVRNQMPEIVADFIGLRRWAAVAAYTGMNGIGPSDVSYQGARYRTTELAGFMPREYDMVRITALLCEKYGLKYMPNTFITQAYFERMELDRVADTREEVRTWSWQGHMGGDDVRWTTHNVLHPAVQDKLVAVWGELADKLRDSPAFIGIGGRLWSWVWEGHWAVSSIFWGYGDWTVAEFTRDTGIAVPGAADDPERFQQRFAFLTGPQREAWIKWRTDKLTAFYIRLRDRVRGDRDDVGIFLLGTGPVDSVYRAEAQGDTPGERLLGMGIDIDRLAQLDGFSIVPIHQPGRGKGRTPWNEQERYDAILDPALKALSVGALRGWHFSPQYDEWGTKFPLELLGVPVANPRKPPHYVGTTAAAGRYDLERFACVLADTDDMVFLDGSFRVNHGNREIRAPWMAEFRRLPRRPFTPLPEARDPVAVWTRTEADATWFYAVNRERFAIPLTVALTGAASVTRLGTGAAVAIAAGNLALELQPFELAAFRAPAGAAVAGVDMQVPVDRVEAVRARLAYAQNVAETITTGPNADDVTAAERAAFLANVDAAWDALALGHIWRARTALQMAPMLTVYERLGDMPEWEMHTPFPDLLVDRETNWHAPPKPFLDAASILAMKSGDAPTEIVASQTYNPAWRYTQVLVCPAGRLELELDLPSAGAYRIVLGHVADAPGPMLVAAAGKRLPRAAQIAAANEPGQTAFPAVTLPAGKVPLTIDTAGSFGVYALQVIPVLRPLPSDLWSTVGPFRSAWESGRANAEVIAQSFAREYPPEANPALDATYTNAWGKTLRWEQAAAAVGEREDRGPNFAIRCGSPKRDMCFATTYIHSPDAREVYFFLGTDWWADVRLNGEILESDVDAATLAKSHVWFSTFKPRGAVLHLKPGWNRILVKNLGGSLGSSCAAWLIDQDGLTVAPTPEAAQ